MDHPVLTDLEELARGAGEIISRNYQKLTDIQHKGEIDLVTEVDHLSERYLISEVLKRFPHHRILSEESGERAGQAEHAWLIDPLDGTVNYAHGVPVFAVSIAYQLEGKLELGVVFDPTRDEMFSAKQGGGACLNGIPIHVSSTNQLAHSLLATGFSYDIRTHPETNLDHFARFSLRSQGIRRLGSAALDLCYVACGRYDGYWELRLNPWDVAAGGLIAIQAGAQVTDVRGGPDFLATPQSILAANPAVHPQMLALLADHLPTPLAQQ
jgi:myo-inositol-1(or 4)-monophosphatase